ncbi:hypothetical protein B5F17_09870 [Butyricicoccus pullicaecorum]|uniref:Uncharacterized protein n=1 Tax=Butyricicoccus pullicaecorum TaxID=501571 RepID=A0A1Y4L6G0_9FIRM|nr:hypothetical protein B5F17_09870 [Butyricicoccus pullicaecorum]
MVQDKQCSFWNIWDICKYALRQFRSKVTRREGNGDLNTILSVLVIYISILDVITLAGRYLVLLYPWVEYTEKEIIL